MTALEMRNLIGKEGAWYTAEGFRILCRVLDVKSAYGRTRYQIEPVHGLGTVWTETCPDFECRAAEDFKKAS